MTEPKKSRESHQSGTLSALLFLVVLLWTMPGSAQPEETETCEADLGPPVTAEEVKAGSLLLGTDQPGLFVAAPTVHTGVELQVHGVIARGRVRQTFRNPTAFWVEGEYVFPLPEEAAIDRLRMLIGERLIEGEIQARRQAQETYEEADREGRKASLVEQERANVFQARIANIGPGEEVVVEIGYLQTLRWVDGGYRLRFPTVVAPRYGDLARPDISVSRHPRVVLPCDDVDVGGRLAAADSATGTLEVDVELAAGGPLDSIVSSYHDVDIEIETPFIHHISLQAVESTDRDFELTWKPRAAADVSARAFVEEREGEFFTLLMVYPPAPEVADELTLPRETVFVIDTSGSMHGESLHQARQALLAALERLRPEDSFNVIQFSSDAERLFESSVPVGRYSLEQAFDYVAGLTADGGTEIREALVAALEDEGAGYPVRQVVLITDGAVANEADIFEYLGGALGESRLFVVGIGSAPNSFFMRRAAALGRGTFAHVGTVDQVGERMSELFHRLESPVLTDLVADWGDPSIDVLPSRLPDIYAGEPLVVIGRGFTPLEGVTLSGSRGALPWGLSLTMPPPARRAGIARLWARRKLGELADELAGSGDPEPLREAALELALSFGLVSRFTSLVAVDRSPSRPDGESPVTRAIPLHLPAGWTHPGLVAGLPPTATPARLWLLIGLLALLGAANLSRGASRGRA